MHDVPDCGMAFATLAAADRLLVLGEPVGARLVVSYKQQQYFLNTGGSFSVSY